MKKPHFKPLQLNKKEISNLQLEDLKGGKYGIPTLFGSSCNIVCDTML